MAQGSAANNFAYDPSGDPTTISSHDSSGNFDTYTQSFDNAGESVSQTPVSGSGGSTSSYTYDTIGDQSAVNGTSYSYNQAGQLASVHSQGGSSGQLLAGGLFHSLALRSDGTVWAWGEDNFGQLGNGTTNSGANINATQVTGLSGVSAVAAGDYHSLALTGTGTVKAWGYNGSGQLGNGTTTNSSTPVQVSNLTGVAGIAGGSGYSLALKSDGTVWAWGDNGYGQLGNGTTNSSSTPVQVSTLSGVVAIAAGGDHSVALKSDGTVWEWGYGKKGELGNGTTNNSSTPVEVSNLTGVTAIAAGADHTLAVRSDGTVWSWGLNANGQLGNGSTRNSSTPVQVSSFTNAKLVAASGNHSMATKTSGTAWAWGDNGYGQLGNGTTSSSSTPVQTSNLSSVAAIAAGADHSLFATSAGTPYSAGNNQYGQLGNGSTNSASTPVQVNNLTAINTTVVAAAYTYNGNGLTAARNSSGTTSQYTWISPFRTPLLAADGTNYYIYGRSGTPVEQVNLSTSTPTYLTYTPGDSSWLTTNSAGDQTGFWRYDAYGTSSLGTPTSSFGYSGQYTDATTGFVNDRARFYEPQIGEFTTRDPAFNRTDTAYTYAADDPVDLRDPTGRFVCEPTVPATWPGCSIDSAEGAVAAGAVDIVGTGLALGIAGSLVWDVFGPAPSAGGEEPAPIWFGQRRIGPKFSDGTPIDVPPNGTPIGIFLQGYEGYPVWVAINNRTLANYSLADVTFPPVVIENPSEDVLERLGEPPLFPQVSLPSPVITVTPNIGCDTPRTDIPGAPDGVVASRSFAMVNE